MESLRRGSVAPRRSPARGQLRLSPLIVSALCLGVGVARADTGIDFRTQVQPILAQHCYECHGPRKRKGDLRLSNRRDAFAPAETGIPVIEPGSSKISMLIDLVSSSDPKERMPKEGKPLSAAEIDVLRRWID